MDVPHYSKLLEFLNLCAQALGISVSRQQVLLQSGTLNDRRNIQTKPIASFAANVLDPFSIHTLYACVKCKSLMKKCSQL